jgi:DNA-binding PadR family transcriptional regulator
VTCEYIPTEYIRDVNNAESLSSTAFHVLLALGESEQHGYAILQEVERRSGGEVRLLPGTLYRTLQRMVEDGLIAEVRKRPALDDPRRRYYRVTTSGAAAARAEVTRLSALVRLGKQRGFGPEPVS